MEFPSKENHGLLELQLVQMILLCKQLEQNNNSSSKFMEILSNGRVWVVK